MRECAGDAARAPVTRVTRHRDRAIGSPGRGRSSARCQLALTGLGGWVAGAPAGGVYWNSSSAPNSVSRTLDLRPSEPARAAALPTPINSSVRPRFLARTFFGDSVSAVVASRIDSIAVRRSACSRLSSSSVFAGFLPLERRSMALRLDSTAFWMLSRIDGSSISRWTYGLDLAMSTTSAGLNGTDVRFLASFRHRSPQGSSPDRCHNAYPQAGLVNMSTTERRGGPPSAAARSRAPR